jgi:hypothetical protein
LTSALHKYVSLHCFDASVVTYDVA